MLDPIILLALQPALPPARPEITIEERADEATLDVLRRDRARRIVEQRVAAYERQVSAYIADLAARRVQAEAVSPARPMTEEEAASFLQTAEDIEFEAGNRARALVRFQKKVARDVRHFFAIDPGLGAAIRSVGVGLSKMDEQAIEAMLEHALFVRAFRAERTPAASTGPTFDNADDLDAYLRAELA